MRHRQEEGFALIVIAALFLAFATMAATLIDRSNATQQIEAQTSTRDRISRISMALVEFYVFNGNRYPCPAATNVLTTNAAFGTSIVNCHSTGIPVSGFTVLPGDATIVGMVPIAALAPYGIAPTDAFDAWNNRIMYVIDRALTPGGTGVTSSTSLRPTVTDSFSTETYRQPDFIVLSYGRDGIGAIPKARTTATIACPVASTYRTNNCNGDLAFLKMPLITNPSATSGTHFDDILSFYGR